MEGAKAMVPRESDDHETYRALKSHGWPKLVVLEAVYVNDESFAKTDAERYQRVLAWVTDQLAGRSQE